MAIIRGGPILSFKKTTAIIVNTRGDVCMIAVTTDNAELDSANTRARPPIVSLMHLNKVAL